MKVGAQWSVWSSEEDARLKQACDGKDIPGIKGWKIIAVDFPGRSALACWARWRTLCKKASGIVPNGRRVMTWSQDEAGIAFNIWQDCFGDEAGVDVAKRHRVIHWIADRLGRDYGSVAQRLKRFGAGFGFNQTSIKKASPQAIADREAREAARNRRDLTACFFGDPPAGFSALDQKRNPQTPGESHASHY